MSRVKKFEIAITAVIFLTLLITFAIPYFYAGRESDRDKDLFIIAFQIRMRQEAGIQESFNEYISDTGWLFYNNMDIGSNSGQYGIFVSNTAKQISLYYCINFERRVIEIYTLNDNIPSGTFCFDENNDVSKISLFLFNIASNRNIVVNRPDRSRSAILRKLVDW